MYRAFEPVFKLLRDHPKTFAIGLALLYFAITGWNGLIYGGTAASLFVAYVVIIVTGWNDDDDWPQHRNRYA
jgi:hypothetical protein